MKGLGSILLTTILFMCSCSRTNFPPTRDAQRDYKQSQDAQFETPKEQDLDKESGLGGGQG